MNTNNNHLEFDDDSIKLNKNNLENSNKYIDLDMDYNNNNLKMENKYQKYFILTLISIILILIILIVLLLKRLNEQELILLENKQMIQNMKISSSLRIINNNDENALNKTIIHSNETILNKTDNINIYHSNSSNNISNIDYNNQTNNVNIYNISEIYKDNELFNINTVKDFEIACINKSVRQIAELYYRVCSNGILLDKNKYKLSSSPKISIIIPLYNREKYILRVLRSIQNQSMKDIEIIFIDDFSTDSTKNIIKLYQKEDERIILIEHSKNEGTLISRNDGVFKARGEYIMFVDSDDLLLPNVLIASYSKAKKFNYEIILFAVLKRTSKGRYFRYSKWWDIKPIYQPKLSSFMYYGKGYLQQIDFHLTGKLIKKEAFIKTINSISDYYLKNHISVNEDGIMNFMLLKKAKSLKYIHFYGYIYDTNPNSVISALSKNINKTIRDYVLYLRYMFEYTDDNLYEKSMAEEQLRFVFYTFEKEFIDVSENFQLIYDSLNLYLNSTFISNDSKKIIEIMINKIKTAENKYKKI